MHGLFVLCCLVLFCCETLSDLGHDGLELTVWPRMTLNFSSLVSTSQMLRLQVYVNMPSFIKSWASNLRVLWMLSKHSYIAFIKLGFNSQHTRNPGTPEIKTAGSVQGHTWFANTVSYSQQNMHKTLFQNGRRLGSKHKSRKKGRRNYEFWYSNIPIYGQKKLFKLAPGYS